MFAAYLTYLQKHSISELNFYAHEINLYGADDASVLGSKINYRFDTFAVEYCDNNLDRLRSCLIFDV